MESAPYTWTSTPWAALAGKRGGCDVTVFGVTGGGRRMRLRVNGREQNLDTSWAVPVWIPEHVREFTTFQYLDPRSGAEVACHEVAVACVPELDPTVRSVTRGPACMDRAPTPRMYTGRPRLVLRHPYNLLPVLGVGAAYVDLHVRIEGEVTEEWWCPAVEVEWPEGTRSRRESDCEPFDKATVADRRRQSWQFGHWLGEGEQRIVVTLSRGGSLVARQTAWVTVGSIG